MASPLTSLSPTEYGRLLEGFLAQVGGYALSASSSAGVSHTTRFTRSLQDR